MSDLSIVDQCLGLLRKEATDWVQKEDALKKAGLSGFPKGYSVVVRMPASLMKQSEGALRTGTSDAMYKLQGELKRDDCNFRLNGFKDGKPQRTMYLTRLPGSAKPTKSGRKKSAGSQTPPLKVKAKTKAPTASLEVLNYVEELLGEGRNYVEISEAIHKKFGITYADTSIRNWSEELGLARSRWAKETKSTKMQWLIEHAMLTSDGNILMPLDLTDCARVLFVERADVSAAIKRTFGVGVGHVQKLARRRLT